ncbi:subfamily C14A unassigned peptidase (C14 family), partial [Reticulomyxa filosa]
LHKNTNKYDGLIIIICGHGRKGNMLVTSDGNSLSIDKIRKTFNCHEMESFKDFPKIFIVDVCRGESVPTAHKITMRGTNINQDISLYGHSDDGFLTIWSTTRGHQVADFSLLSNCMTKVIKSKYKSGYPLKKIYS